ncbi:THO complex subunit 5, partial [Quaeritorhiza haematococci]
MVKRKSPDKHDGDTTVTYGGGASGGDARDERDRNGFSDAMDTTTEQLAAGTSAFSSFFKLQPRLKHLQRTSAVCEKLRQISSSILTEKLNSVSTTTVSGTRSNNDGSASPAAPSQDSTSFENESGSTPGIQSSSTLTSLFNAASLLFLELEQLNRATYVMNRSAKHETQDAKQKMSLQHLALQNLNYERLHLQREIAKCNEMETIYQDIDLVSLDDFNKGAPEELSKVDNEHKLMLNRLQFELDERKRLQKEEKELLAVKEKLAKENKDASADIEKLDTQLENVVKSTQPLQEKLNIQITERHRLVDLGKRLPGPLFVLFQQAYGFAEITGGITVDIIGDATAATTLLEQDRQSAEEGATATASTENDDDDGDNGADEDNDGKPMKKRKVRREVDKKAAQVAFHEKHPLEVVVKIKQNGVPQSSRRKPDDEKPDTSSSSSLSSSSIGWFSEACADGTLVVRPHIGKIVDLVRRRWKALGVLGRILGELATGKQTLPTPIQGTSTKKTKLLDWKEKRQDDSASSSNDLRYTFTVNAD